MSVRSRVNHTVDMIEAIETEIWRSVAHKSLWVGQNLYKGVEVIFNHYDEFVWHPIFWTLMLIILALGSFLGVMSFYAAFTLFSLNILLIEWVRGRMENSVV